MKAPRNWTRLAFLAAVAIVVVSISISFLPSRQQAACKDAEWQAQNGWMEAHNKLTQLHARLLEAEIYRLAATGRDALDLDRWRLWRMARDEAEAAESSAYLSPLRARLTAMAAIEACWAARDNSEPLSAQDLAAVKIEGSNSRRRRYRPGASTVFACEEALARSERSWEACSYRMAEFMSLDGTVILSDYDFFGSGCF